MKFIGAMDPIHQTNATNVAVLFRIDYRDRPVRGPIMCYSSYSSGCCDNDRNYNSYVDVECYSY